MSIPQEAFIATLRMGGDATRPSISERLRRKRELMSTRALGPAGVRPEQSEADTFDVTNLVRGRL